MLASLLHVNSVILSPRPCFPLKAVCKNDGDNCPYDPTLVKVEIDDVNCFAGK